MRVLDNDESVCERKEKGCVLFVIVFVFFVVAMKRLLPIPSVPVPAPVYSYAPKDSPRALWYPDPPNEYLK